MLVDVEVAGQGPCMEPRGGFLYGLDRHDRTGDSEVIIGKRRKITETEVETSDYGRY